jgi:precorrin-3B methylase
MVIRPRISVSKDQLRGGARGLLEGVGTRDFHHRRALTRAVGREDEKLTLTTLGEADPSNGDMSTLVLIGSSETRFIRRPDGLAPWIYTPRHYGGGR